MPQTFQTDIRTTVMNSGLTNKATGVYCVTEAGKEFDNRSGEYLRADFELVINVQAAGTNGAVFSLYVLPSYDGGTNYADGSASVVPQVELKIGDFTISNASKTAYRMAMYDKPLPMGMLKFIVVNGSGQTTTNDATNFLYIVPHLRAGV